MGKLAVWEPLDGKSSPLPPPTPLSPLHYTQGPSPACSQSIYAKFLKDDNPPHPK